MSSLLNQVVQDSIANSHKAQKVVVTAQSQPLSLTIQLLLYAVALLAGVGLIFYLMDLALKHVSFFQNIKKSMKKNYFIILIMFPIFYLIYHLAYFVPNSGENNSIWLTEETDNLLWTASLTFLTTGVLTGTLKWINNLAFFKKQFTEIIRSKAFADVLSDKMKDLALSDDYLLQRNDLDEIWQRVTLCKYRKEFPELYNKLQDKLENVLFKKTNISYYYKNFQITYYVELIDDKYVSTIERTSFTIIRPNRSEFEFDFTTGYDNRDENNSATVKFQSKSASEFEFVESDIETIIDGETTRKKCTKRFSGHLEYHIESEIIHKQNIDDDRIFKYGSARIIDDLTINIEHNDNINITFVPLNNNKFYINGSHAPNRLSYINRDVLLSGDKFIIFYYRNNTNN